MGSGKSTLGRKFAGLTGYRFIDLDKVIETSAGKSIADLFKEDGETHFRVLEHETLLEVIGFDDTVFSVGGGTPCFFDHMDLLNRSGITIYLKYPPEILFEHLKKEADTRPLLDGKRKESLIDYIRKTLARREPFYTCAKHILTYPDISVKILRETVGL